MLNFPRMHLYTTPHCKLLKFPRRNINNTHSFPQTDILSSPISFSSSHFMTFYHPLTCVLAIIFDKFYYLDLNNIHICHCEISLTSFQYQNDIS